MTFTDVIIIYFAIGSPFAVYRFVNSEAGRATVVNALSAWPLWPVEAWRYIFATARKRQAANRRARQIKVFETKREKIRREAGDLSREILQSGSERNVIATRTRIDRYVGLSLAVDASEEAFENVELFRIAGRKNTDAGAACLRRRNAARLVRHHNNAREDFLALAEEIFVGRRRAEVVRTFQRIADLVDDPVAMARISGMTREAEIAAQDIWIPRQEFLEM